MAIINKNSKTTFKLKPSGISVSGHVKDYQTYTELMSDSNPPLYGWVIDATADPTVNRGSAYYRYDRSTRRWTKLYETELMDSENPEEQTYLGWFETPEAVAATIPVGENGWRVMIGSTDTIWTWDSDTSKWVNTAPGAADVAELAEELAIRSPVDMEFTVEDLTGTKLYIPSTKPPRGIRSKTTGMYFAVAPSEYTENGEFVIELMGLSLPGTWVVMF